MDEINETYIDIYIAGSLHARSVCEGLAYSLSRLGYGITSLWHSDRSNTRSREQTLSYLDAREILCSNHEHILEADRLILLGTGGRETFADVAHFCAAYREDARGLPGDPEPRRLLWVSPDSPTLSALTLRPEHLTQIAVGRDTYEAARMTLDYVSKNWSPKRERSAK